MSKGLEALKEYRKQQQGVCVHADDYLDIIEEELKDLDTIKEIFSYYGLEYKLASIREALLLLKQYQGSHGVIGQALITKKLKALEIIKEHTFYCENVDCFVFVNVTKEVNDLLKEILL